MATAAEIQKLLDQAQKDFASLNTEAANLQKQLEALNPKRASISKTLQDLQAALAEANKPKPVSNKLVGAVLGTSGSWGNKGNTKEKVFDGNPNSFFDAPTGDNNWVGLDLYSKCPVTEIRYVARSDSNYQSRVVGGKFEISDSANFSSPTTLHTITAAPKGNETVTVKVVGSGRYVRYLAPKGSFGNIATIEFYGVQEGVPVNVPPAQGKPDPEPKPQPTPPTPQPQPQPQPTPSPVNKNEPKPSGNVKNTNTVKVASVFDGKNDTYVIAKGESFAIYKGGVLTNVCTQSVPFADPCIQLNSGGTVRNINHLDNNGFLIQSNGDVTIENVFAKNFTGYALFAGEGKINVNGFYVDGGSSNESIVRFDGANGTFSNFDLNYSGAHRKACIRGHFNGTISNGRIRGAIVGINPLDGHDGGQALGIWKFVAPVPGGTIDAANQDACLKAVQDAKNKGVKTNTELAQIALSVARDKNGQPLQKVNLDATVKLRKDRIAVRSVVAWNNVTIEYGIRWAAGTIYDYQNGKIVGSQANGTIFHNPDPVGTEYPAKEYQMSEDVIRKLGDNDIKFTNTAFSSTKSLNEFLSEVKRLGVKLIGCTYNGTKV